MGERRKAKMNVVGSTKIVEGRRTTRIKKKDAFVFGEIVEGGRGKKKGFCIGGKTLPRKIKKSQMGGVV